MSDRFEEHWTLGDRYWYGVLEYSQVLFDQTFADIFSGRIKPRPDPTGVRNAMT